MRRTVIKKVASDTRFKGYVHRASKDDPQYIVKSDKTDHIAIHKGKALKRITTRTRRREVERTANGAGDFEP